MPHYDLSFPPKSAYDEFEDSVAQLAIQSWANRIGADLVLTLAQHRTTGGLMVIPHSKWPMTHEEVVEILLDTVSYIRKATQEKG
jgi:hypothetical protein